MPIEWLISCFNDILMALLKTWQYAASLILEIVIILLHPLVVWITIDLSAPTIFISKITPRSHNRDPNSEYHLLSEEQNPVQKDPHHTLMFSVQKDPQLHFNVLCVYPPAPPHCTHCGVCCGLNLHHYLQVTIHGEHQWSLSISIYVQNKYGP
jgi:hypothetical protein